MQLAAPRLLDLIPETYKSPIRRLLPARVRFVRNGRGTLLGDAEARYLHRFVAPGSVVIDGGAHLGGYTFVLAREVGAGGQIISIEPQPDLASLIREATTSLQLPVTVYQCALGATDGIGTLHIPYVDGLPDLGDASLQYPNVSNRPYDLDGAQVPHDPSSESRGSDEERVVVSELCVQLRTLDSIVAGVAVPVSFIKLDLEGGELDALRGAEQALARHRPVLLLELDVRRAYYLLGDLHAFLRARHYRAVYLDSDEPRLVGEETDIMDLPINLFFIPEEHDFLRTLDP